MQPDLVRAYLALDHLNRACRRPPEGGFVRAPTRVVYATKDKALREATAAGLATTRLVHVDTTCRNCGGSTWHTYDDGGRAPCRTCQHTGTVRLTFAETTIALDPPIVWHSPAEYHRGGFGSEVRHAAWKAANPDGWNGKANPVPSEPAGTWRPNAPGVALDPAMLARCLCIVRERWPLDEATTWSDDNFGRWHPYRYDLDLGVAPGEACALCGAPRVSGAHVSDPATRLAWTAPVCGAHPRDMAAWARLREIGPPAIWRTNLDVIRWMEMHPGSPDAA